MSTFKDRGKWITSVCESISYIDGKKLLEKLLEIQEQGLDLKDVSVDTASDYGSDYPCLEYYRPATKAEIVRAEALQAEQEEKDKKYRLEQFKRLKQEFGE